MESRQTRSVGGSRPGLRLEARARAWRSAQRRRLLLEGSTRLACALALAFAAAVWLDQAATLSRRARLSLLAVGAAALAGGAYRLLARPLLALSWAEVFEEAGRALPELRLHLRSAWELSRGAAPAGISEALREEHVRDAERRLQAAGREPDFRWRPDARLGAAAAAAALAAVSLAWAPSGAFARLLRPWRQAPLERFLGVSPGDARVDWGRPVTITATWLPGAPAGRARHELTLWLKPESGGWRRAAWDKAAGDEHRFTADELTSPLTYRLAWRDLESRDYSLAPVLAPQLESVSARLHGSEPAAVPMTPAEPLSVMRGTLVTLAGRPNQPLARAALRLSSLPQALPMKQTPAGEFEASFVAQEDATLRFELETPDGRQDRDAPAYSLKTVADQPPTIELLSPLDPVLASPSDTVPLAYAAKDDGGLSRITLLLRPAGRPPVEVPLQRLNGAREFAGDYGLELSSLPLGKTEFQLKAVDNGSPPQSALSGKGLVDVQDLQAQHARSEQLWRKADGSLKAASERADALRDKLAAGQQPSSEQLDALPKDWDQAARDLRELSDAMKRDAYANQALADEMKSAADGLDQAGRKEVPAAQQAARSGATPEAAQRADRLSRRLAQARRALEQGEKLQAMQDAYQETGRIAQRGASIESQAESLARGAKPTAQQMKKLDAELSRIQKQMEALQKALESLPKASKSQAAGEQSVDMPVEAARDAADQLSRALARGDYDEAAKLARKLSEALSKIQQAMGAAAASSAAASMPPQTQQRVDRAQQEWSQLVEEQGKLVERTQRLEDAKVARRIERQKSLLAELARRQAVAVSSAAAQRGFPQDALSQMRSAQAEFDARRVQSAPALLRAAAGRSRAAGFEGLYEEESEIADKLEEASGGEGKGGAEAGAGPEAEQEGRDQAALGKRAAALKSELRALEDETGSSAEEAVDALSGAQGEQSAAAEALGRRDSAAALPRQQKALELLTQGANQMSQSAAGAQSRRQALIQPFQQPAGAVRVLRGGGGGQSGAQMGFVPLPSSKEYLPPKELREELERSLRENRPASQDALIKEYFKRISQ